MSAAEFAALIGRPADLALRSVVKTGAWHALDLPLADVVGFKGVVCGSGGRYNGNAQLAIDSSVPLTLKFAPSSGTLSVSAYIGHNHGGF